MNYFYKNIKNYIKYNNLTLMQFASKVGLNYSTISRWINNNNGAYLDSAYQISEKLGIPIDRLVCIDIYEENDRINTNEFIKQVSTMLDNSLLGDMQKQVMSNSIQIIKSIESQEK